MPSEVQFFDALNQAFFTPRTYKNGAYYRCSGTLIDDQHIITAAHCMLKDGEVVKPGVVQVFLGAHSLNQLPLPVPVSEIVVDPAYNISSYDFSGEDMAIITLLRPVGLSKFVWPICIPDEDLRARLVQEPDLVIAGWGQTEDGIPVTPREAVVQYLPGMTLKSVGKAPKSFFFNFVFFRGRVLRKKVETRHGI